MLLKRAAIHGIGPIESTELVFAPDVTVLIGPTASGKASIVKAIKAARYAILSDRSPRAAPREVILGFLARPGNVREFKVHITWDDRCGGDVPMRYDVSPSIADRRMDPVIWWMMDWGVYDFIAPVGGVRTELAEGQYEFVTGYMNVFLRVCGLSRPADWTRTDSLPASAVRFLRVLRAVSDPRSSFVILRDPDVGIDPRLFSVVVEAIRAATEQFSKQVLITTHSPLFVAEWPAESIRIIDRGRIRLIPDDLAETLHYNRLAFTSWWMADMLAGEFVVSPARDGMMEAGDAQGKLCPM